MSLRKKINEQLNTALKSKNKNLVSTLRLILAGIKDRDIANRTSSNKEEVKESDILSLLKKMRKQRQDSIDLYKKGGRQELIDIEKEEIKIIDSFLPEQLSEEETQKICEQTINKVGAVSIKDMGKIMGELKKNYSTTIDFSKVAKELGYKICKRVYKEDDINNEVNKLVRKNVSSFIEIKSNPGYKLGIGRPKETLSYRKKNFMKLI